MAPFNKRQIGYIQAIAGRQQHVSLTCGSDDGTLDSSAAIPAHLLPYGLRHVLMGSGTNGQITGANASLLHHKSLLMRTWMLSKPQLCFDSRAVHNNNKLESADFSSLTESAYGQGPYSELDVFNVPVSSHMVTYGGTDGAVSAIDADAANPYVISSVERATEDGFLNSTNIKFRFTLPTKGTTPDAGQPMGQDHYEFRWIVWRHKKPGLSRTADDANSETNMDAIRDGASFRNPNYDFWMGQTGRKRGYYGFTYNHNLDKNNLTLDPPGEKYAGKRWGAHTGDGDSLVDGSFSGTAPTGEAMFTVDDLMTQRINKDDYVVMKDVRFFLGKEHGKSHFEDTLHWDWNDPIDTPEKDLLSSPTLNDKNYRWNMTLLGTTGGANPTKINYSYRWTTKTESG